MNIDVTNEEQIQTGLEQAVNRFGYVTTVINYAGISLSKNSRQKRCPD